MREEGDRNSSGAGRVLRAGRICACERCRNGANQRGLHQFGRNQGFAWRICDLGRLRDQVSEASATTPRTRRRGGRRTAAPGWSAAVLRLGSVRKRRARERSCGMLPFEPAMAGSPGPWGGARLEGLRKSEREHRELRSHGPASGRRRCRARLSRPDRKGLGFPIPRSEVPAAGFGVGDHRTAGE